MKFADFAWIIVFVSIGIAVARLSVRLYGTLASPMGFYVLGNSAAGALYHLKLLAYPDASLQAHALVLLSMLVFVGAALFISSRGSQAVVAPDNRGLKTFFYVTGTISTLSWILLLTAMIAKYGGRHLLSNLWLLEYEFQMQYFGNFNVLNIIVFPTYILKRTRLGVGRRDALLVASSFFGLILAGIKGFLVYSIAAGMLAKSTADRGGLRFRHLAGFGLAIIGYFLIYNVLIDVFVTMRLPDSSFPEALQFLERPYFYMTGAWPAMDVIISGQIESAPVPGFVTFEPFWKIVADLLGIVEPIPRVLPIVPVGPYFFNVFTLAGEVYWDWGVLGLVAFSAAIGGIVTQLYITARRVGYWGSVLLYAIIGYIVIISFFAFYFRFTMFTLVFYILVAGYLPVGLRWRSRGAVDGR